MARTQSLYRCTECGWTSIKWVGRCGECQAWGTVEDTTAAAASSRGTAAVSVAGTRVARPITEARGTGVQRWTSGIGEFDRVLGGGIVPGAAVLLSGEPGVGKSTLLLEVASRAAATGKRVLYVSAEESVDQVRLRAERTNAMHDQLYLASEVDLGVILGQIDQVQPDLVIADSVQTISSSTVDGIAGGTSQVREVASTLIRVAKERSLPVLIVGHVTKDGTIAGPRLLEHLVDVVCHFEGDRQTALRFVRALKNRFGPTDEVGCFDMAGDGIHEVPDPSGLFMSRNGTPVSGTCVTVALEGRRALPVEVQALVVPSSAPAAAPRGERRRRVTRGDAARRARTPRRPEAVRRGRLRLDGRRDEAHRAGRRPGDRAGPGERCTRPSVPAHARGGGRDQPGGRDPAGDGREAAGERGLAARVHDRARRGCRTPARGAARRVLADAVGPRTRTRPRVLTHDHEPDHR